VYTEDNWVPKSFQAAAQALAKKAAAEFVRNGDIVGLGSGPMAAATVKEIGKLPVAKSLSCIASSHQIKMEALAAGLSIVDDSKIPEIDIVFDGADEINDNFDMIKGGGGALLKEKIIHAATKKIVIAAESTKFVKKFTWPVPIEVHPFALAFIFGRLKDLNAVPRLRLREEGYPYVTDNGNLILDSKFNFENGVSVEGKEHELKVLPGIIEVGLFSKHADIYFKASEKGKFEMIYPN
jgi:ribose 5-phosphate isomerase A